MIFLVTGGSASGKSEYAEKLVTTFGGTERYYIATMKPYDEESYRRIDRHRNMRRDKGFTTVERYVDLAGVMLPEWRLTADAGGETCAGRQSISVPAKGIALLECMSNLVANEMYLPEGAGKETVEAIGDGVRALAEQLEHLIIVTNEVFSDGIEYDEFTKEYLAVLGGINQKLAAMADVVVEVVYSIPVISKGAEYVQFI
ncbi:MAG: bifunctional adenosylcobinamide kinase/adenosylcobinamide-phosphate guanylyltransferase [Lachnospiraceae bacterium]|nr:bifunctional adenosylcobinamide kinase/adenosylcobinamide-phosphate guanylyltransferase [Lachnospiraceae bacterium]